MDAVTDATAPADRAIRGDGRGEASWLSWLGAQGMPCAPLDAWVPSEARLVVVAPHPDDEVLMAGGLLHLHAARGGRCRVMVLSDGEASHAGEPGWDASALALRRRAESTEGLRLLAPGVPTERWCLPDGGLQHHTADIAARLQGLLRPGDVLLTTWRHDGHPDHEAAGAAAAHATQRCHARLLEAPVWMWHWARPAEPHITWSRMAGLGLTPEVVARKQRALQRHHSQLQPRVTADGPVLGEAIVARAARRVEYFFTTERQQ